MFRSNTRSLTQKHPPVNDRRVFRLVEMGGIEPPSRTLSHRPTTSLVGVLVSTRNSHRQDFQVDYRIVLDSPYPVVRRVAPRLGVVRFQTGQGTVWMDVATILSGEGELFFASYCFAPFNVVWATTACSLHTYGPVEASHPRAAFYYTRFKHVTSTLVPSAVWRRARQGSDACHRASCPWQYRYRPSPCRGPV